jgi:tetratricopeptide (TPR) repeat protein
LRDNDIEFSNNQILEIFDTAIDKFNNNKNKAFILHLKGEFYLEKGFLNKAIVCFDTNIQNNENEMHSLHSLAKAYSEIASTKEHNSGEFRYYIDIAITKLNDGIFGQYKDNVYYYGTLFSIYNDMKRNGVLSEKDKIKYRALASFGEANLNKEQFNTLTIYNLESGE